MTNRIIKASVAVSTACVLAAALLWPGFPPQGAGTGAARGEDPQWVPLTLLYTTDVKGKIDPCG
jgi:hypothetical protein